jgi:Fic family protein
MLVVNYEQTRRIRELLLAIDRERDILDGYLESPEDWHGAIRRQVFADTVHYSTKIEGNRLDHEQVEAIIAGDSLNVPDKDRVEVENYIKAMEWARTRSADPDWQLDNEVFYTLHFLIGNQLGGDYAPLGAYRQRQNTIEDKITGTVIYYPPPPELVPGLMKELNLMVKRQFDGVRSPYIVNALTHLNFEGIHPFSDGNGRVGRVACSLLMMRAGYKAQEFWSLEEYLGESGSVYGRKIRSTLGPKWQPEKVVATEWIEWYLEAIEVQVRRAADSMRRNMAGIDVIIAGLAADGELEHEDVIERRVLPLWMAVIHGSVRRRALLRFPVYTETTAKRDLTSLKNLGYLETQGAGRAIKYIPGPRMNAWGDIEELIGLAEAATDDAVADVKEAIFKNRDPRLTFDV